MKGWDSSWYRENVLPFLPGILENARWFSGKGRAIDQVRLLDFGVIDIPAGLVIAVVQVSYRSGISEVYLIPQRIVMNWEDKFFDGVGTPQFVLAALKAMSAGIGIELENGRLQGFSEISIEVPEEGDLNVQVISGEQSNTSLIVEGKWVYKSFRKLNQGENPDYSVSSYLYRNCHFEMVPEPLGKLTLETGGASYSAGTLARYVKNSGDGWKYATTALEGIMAQYSQENRERASFLEEQLAARVKKLAGTTASMHNCFSSDTADVAFRPEPVTEGDANEWAQNFLSLLEETTGILNSFMSHASETTAKPAEEAFEHLDNLREFAENMKRAMGEGLNKMRVHGDYHLGQTLVSGSDFFVIDFEGEPMRPLEYRLGKFMPMKDVGGMVRSIEYAVDITFSSKHWDSRADQLVKALKQRLVENFVSAYYEGYAPENQYLPESPKLRSAMLDFYIAEKALYEVGYEIRNRPDFAWIPLRALSELIAH